MPVEGLGACGGPGMGCGRSGVAVEGLIGCGGPGKGVKLTAVMATVSPDRGWW